MGQIQSKIMQTRIQINNSSVKKRLFLLTAFLFFLVSGIFLYFTAAAAQTNNSRSLILSDLYSEHYLSPYLTKYSDPDNTLTADDIISSLPLTGEILKSSGSIASWNMSDETIWLSFYIMNRSTKTNWKIDFGSSFMGRFGLFDNVEIYIYNKESVHTKEIKLDKNRDINLTLPVNQKSQIILKFEAANGIPIMLPLRLLQQDKNSAMHNNKILIISIIMMIGMVFFFAAIALMNSTYGYLYFSLYYLLLTALLITKNIFVTVPLPFIGSSIIPLLFLFVAIAGFLIARLFWNMEERSHFANISFFSLIGLSILCFIAATIFPFETSLIETTLLFGPSLLLFTLIPLISVALSQQGSNEVTPFIFGWFMFLFGLSITILSLSGIIQPISTAINAYWYALIPQALFFIFSTKVKINSGNTDTLLSKIVEIDETDSISRLRQSKENTEQERLLKVIQQERKVLGELRKSEARRTEEMRKAKDIADEANKGKSAFLAVVSHEIRTPMTGIMGMVRLLLDSNLTKVQKEYTQTIQDSSDAMLALLNDILDFEKIEQGKMVFENISFDLHRLIQGVTTLMSGHAVQKKIDLKTKIGDSLPRYVKGDPTRLRQVLLNLTGNAVKFTEKGKITLSAELIKEELGSGEYEIYFGITDNGIGISKEAQKNLFSAFSQADSTISRKFGGTGLGLAISKGLVEGMGSNININSNEGEGSTFFFTLNMAAGHSSSTASVKATTNIKNIKPLSILIVDDNQTNQKVIQVFLNKLPYKLEIANSAEQALEKIKNGNFDLVLMDIELPTINGDQATIKMRQSGDKKLEKIPVIALTGHIQPENIRQYYAAGMNGFVAKPIDQEILIQTIDKAGNGHFESPEMSVQSAPAPKTKKNKKPVFGNSSINVNQNFRASEALSQTPRQEHANTIPALNPETLNTLKGHLGKNDIKEMLDDVIQKTDEIIQGMQSALAQKETNALHARGHELKGMAGNFGLTELSEQAGEIEAKAKTEALIILTSLITPLPEMQKRAKKSLDHWINNLED